MPVHASLPVSLLMVWALAVAFQSRRRALSLSCAEAAHDRIAVKRRAGHDAGASAIEFVFVLPLLVGMFYAVFTYGYVFVLKQALNYASEEAARAAVAVVDGGSDLTKQAAVATASVQQAMPVGFPPVTTSVATPSVSGPYRVQVTVTMPIATLFPVWDLPLIGKVPKLPDQLQAISVD